MNLERDKMSNLTIMSMEDNKHHKNIDEKYKIKKEILQKHYEQKYQKDVKAYKSQYIAVIISTIVVGISAYCTKWKHTELNIGTFVFGAVSLLGPLFKPKKEKYEAAMQKELNEVA